MLQVSSYPHRARRAKATPSRRFFRFEAAAIVSADDKVAVMFEPNKQRGGHLDLADNARPVAEGDFCRDDNRNMVKTLEYDMDL
ncbi:MAG: hypothetical protein AAGM38_18080 [Pseudomonadota bacterium]